MAGVRYKTAAGEATALAHLTVACDGMYSTIRTKLAEPNIQLPSYFVALLLHDCSLPWSNYGHVVLAKPSPILFYPIGSREVRHPFSEMSCYIIFADREGGFRTRARREGQVHVGACFHHSWSRRAAALYALSGLCSRLRCS